MANTLANLARMYTETTGTGTLTLTTAVPSFLSFDAAGVANGATVTYAIYCGPHREIGAGVYTASGLTLTRATVYSSTNAGAKINLTGRSEVFITAAKEDFDSFLTAADAATTYQPLDADLTSIAALSGTNNIYYRSAANTWSSVTVSANLGFSAGTLGSSLGTAATANTGTSGATLPFLNGSNTWSAQNIFSSASNISNILAISTEGGASAGPFISVRRAGGSPATNDALGVFNFQGEDSALNNTNYAQLQADILDPTDGSEDGQFSFNTVVAGTITFRMKIAQGVWVGSPTGGDQGVGTLNAVTLYENGTSLASKYQGLDSELTAIAGLTSAADRLPYFTGSGTAALATFTTAGRNLVDDADASAQRTTLGLGTAAVANTGTSGNTVPFLDGSNTFSAAQVFTTTSSNTNVLFATCVNDDAVVGPIIPVYRDSASPAAFDFLGRFSFDGEDSAGNYTQYAVLNAQLIDPTNGTEAGQLVVGTVVAGTLAARFNFRAGMFYPGIAGGDKGVGTINVSAVYDDNVLLCAPVEFMKTGTVNTELWDQYAIDDVRPEQIVDVPEYEEIQLDTPVMEVRGQKDGTFQAVAVSKRKAPAMETKPVLDDKGRVVGEVKVPKIKRTVIPARTIKRQNELAHEFKAMLDEGFDPRDPKAYFDKMLADEALPGLKTKANWVPNEESNAKRTNRIILALELQTATLKTVYEQVEALKAEVESLKKASR